MKKHIYIVFMFAFVCMPLSCTPSEHIPCKGLANIENIQHRPRRVVPDECIATDFDGNISFYPCDRVIPERWWITLEHNGVRNKHRISRSEAAYAKKKKACRCYYLRYDEQITGPYLVIAEK